MNISKLYQLAHALRMEAKRMGCEKAPAEFYVGQVIGDCFINPEVVDEEDGCTATITFLRATEADKVIKILRFHNLHPAARRELLLDLSWPPSWRLIWQRLLGTYGTKPWLLLAIADGMEA